jgi:hypothetical protein
MYCVHYTQSAEHSVHSILNQHNIAYTQYLISLTWRTLGIKTALQVDDTLYRWYAESTTPRIVALNKFSRQRPVSLTWRPLNIEIAWHGVPSVLKLPDLAYTQHSQTICLQQPLFPSLPSVSNLLDIVSNLCVWVSISTCVYEYENET